MPAAQQKCTVAEKPRVALRHDGNYVKRIASKGRRIAQQGKRAGGTCVWSWIIN